MTKVCDKHFEELALRKGEFLDPLPEEVLLVHRVAVLLPAQQLPLDPAVNEWRLGGWVSLLVLLVLLLNICLNLCLFWVSFNFVIDITNAIIGINFKLSKEVGMLGKNIFVEYLDTMTKDYGV